MQIAFFSGSILRFINQLMFTTFIIFAVKDSEDILYAAFGSLIGSLISNIFGWYILKKRGYSIIPDMNFANQLNLLKSSMHYALSSLFSLMHSRGGILIGKILLNDYQLGLLSTAYRLIEILLEFFRLIQKPFGPRIIKIVERKGNFLKYYKSLIRLVFWFQCLQYFSFILILIIFFFLFLTQGF